MRREIDRMYAVRRWDEEVIKWMAVGMVLAMVGLVAATGNFLSLYGQYVLISKDPTSAIPTAGFLISDAATFGVLIYAGLAAGPAGWAAAAIIGTWAALW